MSIQVQGIQDINKTSKNDANRPIRTHNDNQAAMIGYFLMLGETKWPEPSKLQWQHQFIKHELDTRSDITYQSDILGMANRMEKAYEKQFGTAMPYSISPDAVRGMIGRDSEWDDEYDTPLFYGSLSPDDLGTWMQKEGVAEFASTYFAILDGKEVSSVRAETTRPAEVYAAFISTHSTMPYAQILAKIGPMLADGEGLTSNELQQLGVAKNNVRAMTDWALYDDSDSQPVISYLDAQSWYGRNPNAIAEAKSGSLASSNDKMAFFLRYIGAPGSHAELVARVSQEGHKIPFKDVKEITGSRSKAETYVGMTQERPSAALFREDVDKLVGEGGALHDAFNAYWKSVRQMHNEKHKIQATGLIRSEIDIPLTAGIAPTRNGWSPRG